MIAYGLHRVAPGFSIATIGTRFHAAIEWARGRGNPADPAAADDRQAPFSFELLRQLVPAAFAIAMLGAIESLLSAVVSDGMTGASATTPTLSFVALRGIGNLLAPFFRGIAATGALARTAATGIALEARGHPVVAA